MEAIKYITSPKKYAFGSQEQKKNVLVFSCCFLKRDGGHWRQEAIGLMGGLYVFDDRV